MEKTSEKVDTGYEENVYMTIVENKWLDWLGKGVLTIYLYLISYFYTLSYPWSWSAPLRLIGFGILVHVVCEALKKIRITIRSEASKWNWRFGAAVFGISMILLGVYYVAFYPGGIIIDSFNQWYQVQTGVYVDWHPVVHTLLFMKLPSLICNSLAFVNFVQMLWISLAMMYLGMVLEHWGIRRRYVIIALLLALTVPASGMVLSFCWKDTALTIFTIVLAAQMIEIICSNGEWLCKWSHVLELASASVMAMLMRHNGILLVGPMLFFLVLFFWKKAKKFCIGTVLLFMVLVVGIKGPFYRLIHVQSHSQVSAEMLGVPMTILANVLVNEPEKLDEDCREFLYRIGDQELWEQTYQEGNWNSAKWMGDDISNDVIEEVGAEKVLTYTWHAIQRSPYYSYRAVVKLFDVVWKPFGNAVTWSYHTDIQENNGFGYKTTGVPALQKILDWVYDLSIHGGVLFTWCWHIGFYILLLMFVGVSRFGRTPKKSLLWLPVLAYNFGTALLLCGPDFRFFSFNTVITFPLLLTILGERNTNEECRKELP